MAPSSQAGLVGASAMLHMIEGPAGTDVAGALHACPLRVNLCAFVFTNCLCLCQVCELTDVALCLPGYCMCG